MRSGRLILTAVVLTFGSNLYANSPPTTDPNNTQALQDAQYKQDLGNLSAEAAFYRLVNPAGYSNPALRQSTYLANLELAKSKLKGYAAQAKTQLKDPFQFSFLLIVEAVGQKVRIINDPRETDNQAGSRSVNDIDTLMMSMFQKALRVQAAMSSLDLSPQVTSSNSLDSPDPRVEVRSAGSLKMANGKPAPGKDFADKARHYVAESFERMVRVFIAGTDQLKRDTGVPWKGAQKIQGMYQGFTPDLLNSIHEDNIVPGNFCPGWARCGIANLNNGVMQYFKFPDDTYQAEGPGKSHACTGSADADAGSRGDMVNLLMTLMKKMQDDLIKKGKVIQPPAYGVLDNCASTLTDIQVYRDQIKAERDEMYKGQSDQTNAKELIECAQESDFQLGNLRDKKTMDGAQMRSCYIAAMQNRVEIFMMTKYMYCTWRSVAEQILNRMENALQTKSEFLPPPTYREA